MNDGTPLNGTFIIFFLVSTPRGQQDDLNLRSPEAEAKGEVKASCTVHSRPIWVTRLCLKNKTKAKQSS